MQKFLNVALLILLFSLVGMPSTHAQAITAGSPFFFSVTGSIANCPLVSTIPSGTAGYCFTNTGLAQSISGSAWVLAGSGATPSLTINGTTKVLPGPFTITAAAPVITDPTATTPVVTVQ